MVRNLARKNLQRMARQGRGALTRVPVWAWRLLMSALAPGELRRYNEDPVAGVHHFHDIDFVGDGIPPHRLDVIVPAGTIQAGTIQAGTMQAGTVPAGTGPALPVYIYFHGGGWTSGDKASLTKYCAVQAAAGAAVVNVNYRMAPHFHLGHVLADANSALSWVQANIGRFGGDPARIVLGGDSAGGQISALLTAATFQPVLAAHFRLAPAAMDGQLRGLVQHCSIVDFSVFFEKGFVMSLNFIRMLLPHDAPRKPGTARHLSLREAAHFMSPIEWLDSRCPPVFITTSERDFFYASNLNLIRSLDEHGVAVDSLIYGWDRANTEHTWQQNFRHPESQEVYRRLESFITKVTAPA